MFRLLVCLFIAAGLYRPEPRYHIAVFLNIKQDTATVRYTFNGDTAVFEVNVLYKDQFNKHHNFTSNFRILKQLKAGKTMFVYFDDSRMSIQHGQVARSPDYFKKVNYPHYKGGDKRKLMKEDYQKMVEYNDAFFNLGVQKTLGINTYKLKKVNHHGGGATVWYCPDLGPLRLQVDSGDEEVGRLMDGDFELYKIDCQDPSSFLYSYCKGKARNK